MRVISEKIRTPVLHFLVLLSVYSSISFAPPETALDVSSIDGQLSLLEAILARHPGLINENLGFRRNLFELVADVPRVRNALGANAAPLTIGDTRLTGAVYFGVAAQYDSEAITGVRQALSTNSEALELATFTNLAADLQKIRELNLPNGRREAQFRAFFRLAPLIYDADGNAVTNTKQQLRDSIQTVSPGEIENAYQDRFRNHLRSRLNTELEGQGQLRGWLDNTNNQFIQNEIISRVVPRTTGGQIATRGAISVERVPPAVGLLIRNFGRDCGLSSVPYFPLLKDTHVYIIRDSLESNARPKGYALVTEVMHNGHRLPYVVTLNGVSLSDADFKATIRMIAAERGVAQVILPNDPTGAQRTLANTDPARRALASGHRTQISVTLPTGWSTLTQPEFRHAAYRGNNYYDPTPLSTAQLVSVDSLGVTLPEQPRTSTVKNPYRPRTSNEIASRTSLAERAILSTQAIRGMEHGDPRIAEIRTRLGVSEAQTESARVIVDATHANPMSLQHFLTAREHLQFTVADIENLDVLTRTHSLSRIYTEYQAARLSNSTLPALATDQQWERLFRNATRALDREVIARNADQVETLQLPQESALIAWIEAQMAVPKTFRSSLLQDPKLYSSLVDRHGNSDSYSQTALQLLTKDYSIPASQVARLNGYLRGNDPQQRMNTLDLFASIGSNRALSQSTINFIVENISHEQPYIRCRAITALGHAAEHNRISDAVIDRIISNLTDTNQNVYDSAIFALGQISKERPIHSSGMSALNQLLLDPEIRSFRNSSKALVAISEHRALTPGVLTTLIRALSNNSESIRVLAAGALFKGLPHNQISNSLLTSLINNLANQTHEVRVSSGEALVALAKNHPIPDSVLVNISSALSNRDQYVKWQAIEVLRKIAGTRILPNSLVNSLFTFFSHENREARLAATSYIREISSRQAIPSEAYALLNPAIRSGEIYSIMTVGNIALHQAVPDSTIAALIPKMSHYGFGMEDESIRREAMTAAQHILPRLAGLDTVTPTQLEFISSVLESNHPARPGRDSVMKVIDSWLSRPGTRKSIANLLQERGVMLLPQQITANTFLQDLNRYREGTNACVRMLELIGSQRAK